MIQVEDVLCTRSNETCSYRDINRQLGKRLLNSELPFLAVRSSPTGRYLYDAAVRKSRARARCL